LMGSGLHTGCELRLKMAP